MIKLKSKKNIDQRGFTLIELISVVVILGVLSAISLPRFLDLSEDSYSNVARATIAAYQAAVTTHGGAWQARGQPATINGIPMNANGFPGPVNPFTTDCVTLWGMLETTFGINNFTGIPNIPVGNESWTTLGDGSECYYIYDGDITPFRLFAYTPSTGNILLFF